MHTPKRVHVLGCPNALRVPVDLCACGGRDFLTDHQRRENQREAAAKRGAVSRPGDVTMKKKPTLKVKASIGSGSCFLYSDTGPMVCPLCGVTVPKSTPHRCEKRERSKS